MSAVGTSEPTCPAPAANRQQVGRRNLRVLSLTSFLTDVSSEMVFHLLPLYLTGVIGVGAHVIGLIEGVASSLASLVKLYSGVLSDRLRARKGLAVLGYAVSALAKPGFVLASTWGSLAAVRWSERLGKGLRTAPRDALLADGAGRARRGLAFGLHRAADTAGAVVGLGVAMALVGWSGGGAALTAEVFRSVVLWSLVPAFLAVLILAVGAREVPPVAKPVAPRPRAWRGWRRLGRPFAAFLAIVALFDLGNSADAFLILRASQQGAGVVEILSFVLVWNVVFALTSAPGGWLSDRLGRRPVLAIGWVVYSLVYCGFAAIDLWPRVSLWALFASYGVYQGLTHGTAKALVADFVAAEDRGTAYGTYHGVLGLLDLPASVVAGVLWHGAFGFPGLGPWATFAFGAGCALTAAIWLVRSPTLAAGACSGAEP